MTDVSAKIQLEGDFFTHDPGKTLRQNVRAMLDVLADWMEEQARAAMAPGEVRDRVRGYTTSTQGGGRWGTYAALNAVTEGMATSDAIRVKAKLYGRHDASAGHGTTVGIEKRFHPFRRVQSGVYRSRPIIQANLTKHLE